MPITKIVSGGQTGADRGGLDASIYAALPHGGWCPRGRRADDGVIPDKYQLTEAPSPSYLHRTEANVVDSDATLIFTIGRLSGGSLRTLEFAQKHKKPYLHIDLEKMSRWQAVDAIVKWLKTECPAQCVLNVAGSRESKAAGIRGIVKARMIDVINDSNGRLLYPLSEEAQDDENLTPGASIRWNEPEITIYHPKTIDEAVNIIIDILPPESKEEVRRITNRKEFRTSSHFDFALWIRNSMIHQNQNIVDLMADFQKGCRDGKWNGMAEPDDVSGVIVELVWDRLHGKAPHA